MLGLQLVGLIMTIGGTAALVAAVRMQQKARRQLRAHFDHVAPAHPANKTLPVAPTGRFEIVFNRPLRLIFAVGAPYVWGMRASAPLLLAIAIGAGICGWILAVRLLGASAWIAALISAITFFFVPRMVLLYQQRSTEARFMELFPTGIDMMVRMLRAGLPIAVAVRTIQTDSSAPLNAVFGSIADQIALNVPFQTALDNASVRIGLPDFRFLAVALNLQHSTGGNLAATLEILGDLIRKRRALRLKAKAAMAEVRVSAYVLGALPFVTIGALLLLEPDYIAPLFYDERGKFILGAVAILLILAFVTMRQMVRRVTMA
jgi:tight adherence protein B